MQLSTHFTFILCAGKAVTLCSCFPCTMDGEVCLGFLYDDSISKHYKMNQLPSLVTFAKRSLSVKKGKIVLPSYEYGEATKEGVTLNRK